MEPEESSLKEKTKEYPSIRTLQLIGTDEGYVGKGSKKRSKSSVFKQNSNLFNKLILFFVALSFNLCLLTLHCWLMLILWCRSERGAIVDTSCISYLLDHGTFLLLSAHLSKGMEPNMIYTRSVIASTYQSICKVAWETVLLSGGDDSEYIDSSSLSISSLVFSVP